MWMWCWLLALSACSRDKAPFEPPDTVVVVSIDTLRADYLGCYGHPFVQTPNLDALAETGVRFAHAMAPAPTTQASHMSLFTGTYPHTHGVPRNGFVASADNQTLAEVLSGEGWATAGFIGAHPLTEKFGFSQGFDEWHEGSTTIKRQAVNDKAQRPADEVVDDVFEWLDTRQRDEKLFLFVHVFDVHMPYTPPAPFGRLYRKDDLSLTGDRDALQEVAHALEDDFDGHQAELDAARRMYAGGVTWVDHELGRLFDGLEKRGRWDTALVSVTADHGESFAEHGEVFNHGRHVFEETAHVPWLLHLPGNALAGTVVPSTVSLVDVMPTVLRALQLQAPARVEGLSRWPELNGKTASGKRDTAFIEATKPHADDRQDGSWRNADKMRGVAVGHHKWMWEPLEEQGLLFDLSADPGEQQGRRHGGEMARTLEAWAASADPLEAQTGSDRRTREMLRELGYLEEGEDEGDTDPVE